MTYPTDSAQARAALRRQLQEEGADRGRVEARRVYLSIRCDEMDHECLNDGSGCLCGCHDPRSLDA